MPQVSGHAHLPAGLDGGPVAAQGVLAGVRVLDFSTTFSGPYCTLGLADLGADVLKVEAPGGDITRQLGHPRPDMASIHVAVNRGKATVELDLKSDQARALVDRLVLACDVLVHNMRPKAADALGIGPERCLQLNPRLIHTVITGYGSDGPRAGAPAYDDSIQADSGLAWLQSMGSADPAYMSTAVADKVAGMAAQAAVTAALLWRERSGLGQAVEIPMYETLVGFALMEQWGGRAYVPAEGPTGYHRLRAVHRRPYRTSDGVISVVVYHDAHWRRFLELTGRLDLLEDPRYRTTQARGQHIDGLYAILEGLIAQQTTDHWLVALAAIDVPATRVRSLDELFDEEHLKAVDFFRTVQGRDGAEYVVARPAARFSRAPCPDPQSRRGPDRRDEGWDAVARWLQSEQDVTGKDSELDPGPGGTPPDQGQPSPVGVVELAELTVLSGAEAAFTSAYHQVLELLSSTRGCRSVRLTRSVETPQRFVLLVEWESVEAHLEGFRDSGRAKTWSSAVAPFFAGPPRVEHLRDVARPVTGGQE